MENSDGELQNEVDSVSDPAHNLEVISQNPFQFSLRIGKIKTHILCMNYP